MDDDLLINKVNMLLAANAEPYYASIKQVRDVITKHFSVRIESASEKSEEEYFNLLEKVDVNAKKIARAIILEKNRDENDYGISGVTGDQQTFYSKFVTQALKNDVDRLLETLSKHQYHYKIHGLIIERQVIGHDQKLYPNQLPITDRLKEFSLALDACLSGMKDGNKAGTPGKKVDIYREMFIAAMTDTWTDMTGLPPKQLTIDYSQYDESAPVYKKDEFSEFLIKGIALFGRELNLEEVARSMVEHHRTTLEHYETLYKTHLDLSKKEGISPQMKKFYASKAREFRKLSKGLMKK